jgi:hypothetical protein
MQEVQPLVQDQKTANLEQNKSLPTPVSSMSTWHTFDITEQQQQQQILQESLVPKLFVSLWE